MFPFILSPFTTSQTPTSRLQEVVSCLLVLRPRVSPLTRGLVRGETLEPEKIDFQWDEEPEELELKIQKRISEKYGELSETIQKNLFGCYRMWYSNGVREKIWDKEKKIILSSRFINTDGFVDSEEVWTSDGTESIYKSWRSGVLFHEYRTWNGEKHGEERWHWSDGRLSITDWDQGVVKERKKSD